MECLTATSVGKSFGGVHALQDVSIEVRPGEIHGLIGPNGSGKTTLLNMLSGYYPADTGSIAVGSTDLTRSSVQARAQLGIARTFQKPRPLESLTVLENAMLGGWTDFGCNFMETALSLPRSSASDGNIRERALGLLEGVGLGYAVHHRANALEHGELRFLEIARSLVQRPRFILLDEPAGGLSDHEIDALERVVRTLGELGLGVLIVEHHTDFVFRLCDRVTVLNLGRTLSHGKPEVVRNDPEVISVYLGA